MRYFPNHYKQDESCDDCGAPTRGLVNHDDGQPSDPERGPHAGEVPTMHPLCATCWVQWKEAEECDHSDLRVCQGTGCYRGDVPGGEDEHLEMAYEDAQAPSGWDFV